MGNILVWCRPFIQFINSVQYCAYIALEKVIALWTMIRKLYRPTDDFDITDCVVA